MCISIVDTLASMSCSDLFALYPTQTRCSWARQWSSFLGLQLRLRRTVLYSILASLWALVLREPFPRTFVWFHRSRGWVQTSSSSSVALSCWVDGWHRLWHRWFVGMRASRIWVLSVLAYCSHWKMVEQKRYFCFPNFLRLDFGQNLWFMCIWSCFSFRTCCFLITITNSL